MSKRAIIIGAGPAGLTAAYLLLRGTDIKPIVLEADSVVGGLSRTVEYHGNRIDLGGHRFFSKDDRVLGLWKTLMPLQGAPAFDDRILNRQVSCEPGGPDPEREDRVILLRNRISRILFAHKFFDYPISLKLRTLVNMGWARTVYAGLGYLKAVLFKRREISLEDFYINRFGKPLYRMFFEDYTEKLWGMHPSCIAPDWGVQRVKGLSLSKALLNVLVKPFRGKKSKNLETSLIEEFMYPKKGPGQLWKAMADEIRKMGGDILFDSEVVGIQINGDKIRSVEIKKKDGQKSIIEGDIFFSSMPITDLISAMGTVVPEPVQKVGAGLPYRDFMTVGLLLKKLKIQNTTNLKTLNNIVPDNWIYIQDRNVKVGRLQIFNNWSPYMVKNVGKYIWIGMEYFCSEGDDMWMASDGDFIRFAADELVRLQIIEDSADVLDAVRIRVKKAYPAYFGTYGEFAIVKDWLNSISNLYCIGRNGQHRYNNMDHSMLTAWEAVNGLLQGDDTKEKLWNVNTEDEYHETRSRV